MGSSGPAGSGSAPSRRKYEAVPFDEVLQEPLDSGEALIKGLLDCGAMSVLYGDFGSGKTFFALALSYAIATGQPFVGRKVKQGRVIYISLEGRRGMRKRLGALCARKYEASVPLHLIRDTINLHQPNKDDSGKFIAEIKAAAPMSC